MPSLPGTLHPSNRDALAWNNKGVLAYGCHAAVVFVDAIRLEVFQTLEQHSAAVNLVSWKPDKSFLKGTDCDLRCASCDIGGQVIVWDVISASAVSTFRSASTVLDMKWFEWQDTNPDFILTLQSSFSLVMWNSGTGEKIWEHKLGFNAFKFAIDPFESSNIALCSAGSNLVLMEDVVVQNPPSGRTTTITMRRQDKPQKESIIQQVEYHLAYRNIVFVMFSNEVFCVETVSKQVIYTAQVDSSSPLTQILPCSERDAFFMIHQDGFISLRVAKLHPSAERFNARLDYERVCFTEAQRASSKLRVFAARLCPVTQSTVAVLFNSGKLMFYQLSPDNCAEMKPYRLTSLPDSIRLTDSLENECTSLRLAQYGVLSALSGTVTVVRMRPMESVSSDPDTLSGMHLAAVGTTTGMIHLVNVFNCKIERDIQVHSCPIKCLEWGGSNMIISAAYSSSLSASSTVRNDVFATDIRTGVKKRIRPEADESPIELLRVSFYQCYLALSFRNDPLEIWELKTMRLLRRMSRRCPVIIDMAWSGKHHKVQTVSEKNIYRENLVVLDNENHLYHVVIKGLHVRDGKEVNTEWKSGTALLRCMVWKDDLLAFGDTAGRIGVWDLSRKMCRQTGMSPSSRGPVVKCVFSRLAGDSTLAVQHPTSVVVWDTDTLHQLQQFHQPGLNIVDVDMCGLSPIYVASDGIFRYALDGTRNSPVPERDIPLLVRNGFVRLLEASCHEAELKTEELSRFHVPTDDVSYLQQLVSNSETVAQRCAAIYRFLGCSRLSQLIDILQSSVDKHLLPPNLHLFWQPEIYRSRMEDLTRVLVGTCKSAEQLEHCVENAIVLGKNDWATFMLLNNDQAVTSSDFRIHAMKACLLSASMSTEECRCLVKLTATNLIASNYVSDGIQLLCLIDQCLDACRYLISQGSWMQSVSYAKMYPKCEARDVVLKYIDYLSSDHVAFKSLAVMLLASLREREKLLNMLRPVAGGSVLKVVDAVLEEQRRVALTSDALQPEVA